MEKVSKINHIRVVSGIVEVQETIQVIENGQVIASQIHGKTIPPGQDYSKEPAEVQAICKTVHTKAVVDAYKAKVTNGPTETDS